ncbi:MAG: alpha/beta hydrolase [Synechococcales bacterium]|nr:alpha/beta hydrolase [Synechococcales bacterium]
MSDSDWQNFNLVLLPGLDGTGRMFQPLLDELPPELEAYVVNYSPTDLLDYPNLVEVVAEDLAMRGDVVLLGESFSGPIALELASRDSESIKGIIFCATFAESPRPLLLRLLNFIPLRLILRLPLPPFALKLLCLGLEASSDLVESLQEVLAYVPPATIAYRLRLLNNLRARHRPIEIPCCYIQATYDRLVPPRSLFTLQQLIPDLQVVQIPGPHLILQARPVRCAEVVMAYLRSLPATHSASLSQGSTSG